MKSESNSRDRLALSVIIGNAFCCAFEYGYTINGFKYVKHDHSELSHISMLGVLKTMELKNMKIMIQLELIV